MTIQFSRQEIEKIRGCFNKIAVGKTRQQLPESYQEPPEWNTIFLLLRKLLAYGIYYEVPADQEMSYKDLQKTTQKSKDMLMNVHAHLSKFEKLVDSYLTNHPSQ